MKKLQIREKIITKAIIGICVIIFLFIMYDVLVKSNIDNTLENRIEAKLDEMHYKTDKILEIVSARVEQTKNSPLFNNKKDTNNIKQNLERLKVESFDVNN